MRDSPLRWLLDLVLDHPVLTIALFLFLAESIKKAWQRSRRDPRTGLRHGESGEGRRAPDAEAPPAHAPRHAPPPVPRRPPPAPARRTPPPVPGDAVAPAPFASGLPPALESRLAAARSETQKRREQLDGSDHPLRAAADALAEHAEDLDRRSRLAATAGDARDLDALSAEADALLHGSAALGTAIEQRRSAFLPFGLADAVAGRVASDASPTSPGSVVGVAAEKPVVPEGARRHLRARFVALPPRIQDQAWRWAFVAREALHDRIARDPSLSREMERAFGEPDPDLWEDRGHQLACGVTRAWSTDLGADVATAHLLGPAWVEALVADAAFASAASRFAVRGDLPAAAFGSHVTGDVRIGIVLRVLDRAGWRLEAEALADWWDQVAPKPPTLACRVGGEMLIVPREVFLEHVDFLADRIAGEHFVSLGGTLAGAFAGATRSSSFLDSVQTARGLLREGVAVDQPLRVVLAAGAGLFDQASSTPAVREALLISLAKATAGFVPALRTAAHAPRAVARRSALVQAIVLGDALTPFVSRMSRPSW